jgi:ABC-2 type transport system ATP-binding protein
MNHKSTSSLLQPVFIGNNIHKQYKKGGFELSPLTLQINLGEINGVVGENGNGKSTLIKLIAGEEKATSGSLNYPLFDGPDWRKIKSEIAYIPQRLHKWDGDVRDYLQFTVSAKGIYGKENNIAVDYIIERLGLKEYEDYDWNELSGGYQMRFELARMLVWKPKLLLLDEPLAHLDINAQAIFLKDLEDLSKDSENPFGVIITSQHLYEVESISKNVIFLRKGKTIYNGPINEFEKERTCNSFELSSTLSSEELIKILSGLGFEKIENKGNTIIVHIGISVSSREFITGLFNAGLELKYFRNISQSTRKLF